MSYRDSKLENVSARSVFERQDNVDVEDETAADAIVSDLPPGFWIRVSRQDR